MANWLSIRQPWSSQKRPCGTANLLAVRSDKQPGTKKTLASRPAPCPPWQIPPYPLAEDRGIGTRLTAIVAADPNNQTDGDWCWHTGTAGKGKVFGLRGGVLADPRLGGSEVAVGAETSR